MSTESARAGRLAENLEVRWLRFLQRAAGLLACLSVVLAGAGLARRQVVRAERDAARRDCVCCPGATFAQDNAHATADAGSADAGAARQPADEEDGDQ